jgi:hypothetical protein
VSSQLVYTVDTTFGCWLWIGKRNTNGRPIVWRGRTPFQAHRASYEHHDGPVPTGLELDHECRNTDCVRPAHLRAVTRRENEFRKQWSFRVRIATCKRGHDMKDAIVTGNGGRVCRTCSRSKQP